MDVTTLADGFGDAKFEKDLEKSAAYNNTSSFIAKI